MKKEERSSRAAKPTPYTFESLVADYRAHYGVEYPTVFHPDPKTEPLCTVKNFGRLCVSEAAAAAPNLPVFGDNLERAPCGSWLSGFWGYGTNSYAWHFVRKDEKRFVFLRLGYGGYYTDPKSCVSGTLRDVARYEAFEKWAAAQCVSRWAVIMDMGSEFGWVEWDHSRREWFGPKPGEGGRVALPNEPGYEPGEAWA